MLFGFCLGIWRHYLPCPHAGLCNQCWEIVGNGCCFPYVRFFYSCLFYFVSLITCTWGFYFCFLFCFFFLLWGSSLHHLTIELAFLLIIFNLFIRGLLGFHFYRWHIDNKIIHTNLKNKFHVPFNLLSCLLFIILFVDVIPKGQRNL